MVLRSHEAASDSSVLRVACGIPQNRLRVGSIDYCLWLLVRSSTKEIVSIRSLHAEPQRVAVRVAVLVTRRMLRDEREQSTHSHTNTGELP